MTGPEANIIDKLQHPYYMVIAGVIIWHVFSWWLSKTSIIWWRKNAPGVIASLLLGFSVVIWDDEWAGLIMEYRADFELKPGYYLLIGPATELVLKAVIAIKNFNPFKRKP